MAKVNRIDMVKYLVVFLMVMLAIANGYGGSKEADNARARLFASNSQLGKPNFFFNLMRYSSCQQCDPAHFSRIVPLRYPPSGRNPGATHDGNVVQAHFSRIQPLRYPPSGPNPGPPHASSMTQAHFLNIRPLRYPPSGPNPGAPHLAVWLKPIFLKSNLSGILPMVQTQAHLILVRWPKYMTPTEFEIFW